MTTDSTLDNSSNIDIFGGDEFVFTKNHKPDGTTEIIGGGYKVNSFFLQDGLPAMTTFNNSQQTGGKVSSPFENLAVPAGLFYINQKIPKNDNLLDKPYQKHEMLSDDIMDKLFRLVNVDKKRKRKTRKHNYKLNNRKTRKNI
jgi:hypothetical protein